MMFVAKWMTANPVTVTPDTSVAEAKELLIKNKFRRLPVVKDKTLLGILTDRDLREVAPSPATTLSKLEANYLLDRVVVRDIMKKHVLTIHAEAMIEEAALIMCKEKIGGLVVLDASDAVVGIITETDIFKSFVEVMGLAEGKTRLTIGGANQVGVLHEITGVFQELNINIVSMVISAKSAEQAELIIRADVAEVGPLTQRLSELGYPVLHVVQIG